MIRENKVLVYIDDILIATSLVEENTEVLKETLLFLKRYRFELNYKKCHFLKTKIEYLGYVISTEGITLTARHTEAVRNFPQPKKVVDVQRFLGLTNFFRRFIQDYAKIAKPLYNLLKGTTDFNFDNECCQAFNTLKQQLTAYPVLRLYNPTAETELHTDASSAGLAAILLQKQSKGQWAPVAYYSQSTNKAEANYHSFELEMLAIVRAIERCHIYLYGIEFTVVTDCNVLVYAVNKANLNPRIARWTLQLQNYIFKVTHRHGRRMTHVDVLSRNIGYIEALPLERVLEFRQLQNPRLLSIAEELEKEDSDKFELIERLIYRKAIDKPRFVVPESMVNNIIRVYHDEMAHYGFDKTIRGISANYWLFTMRKRVKDYIENCLTCLTHDISANSREGEIQATDSPTEPGQIWHVDHFGPLAETTDGYKYILVVIDAFTRYTWLSPEKSTRSKDTIEFLEVLFNTVGAPRNIVSDWGTAFTSQEFADFIAKTHVKHRLVAVAAPWANGLVERVNRFLKSSLKELTDEPTNWKLQLMNAQYVLNNTIHSSLKSTPAKLLFDFEQSRHI